MACSKTVQAAGCPTPQWPLHQVALQTVALQAVAVVQRAMRVDNPCTLMGQMGFGPLALVARFPVSMSGMCSRPASRKMKKGGSCIR